MNKYIDIEYDNDVTLFKIASAKRMLAAARLRKAGYEKMNRSALWFSTYYQDHKIEIIDKVIERLRWYIVDKARTLIAHT